MVSFRRIILAMSMLALFVGLAGAQVGSGGGSPGGPLTCTAFVSVPPTLRSEGLTELIGDIVIQCTGGTITTAPGAQVPTANFTVSLGTNVTSKLLSNGASEALLFVDEPGTGQAGPGPAFVPTICSSASIGGGVGGCNNGGTGSGLFLWPTAPSPGNGTTIAPATCTTVSAGICTSFGTVTNVFQGTVSGNQVTFNGVPIIAPVTGGFTRVFRITNVRANVAGLGGGGLPGTTQLLASVSISGSTALPVANPVQIAGFIQSGLTTTVRNSSPNDGKNTKIFLQCNSTGSTGTGAGSGPTPGALVEFKENFATAFKTRIAANATNNGAGIGASSFFFQGTPGINYNSESGLVFNTPNGTAGLADFGTRLKAVFSNIPAGVRVFVTTTNMVTNNAVSNSATVNAQTTVNNGLVAPAVAVMVPTETGPNFAGLTPTGTNFSGGANMAEVVIVNGSGTAVWEVVQANPSAIDTFQFGVNYIVTGNQQAGTPAAGNSQVNLSYAPISTVTTASGSASIPRFVDTSTATTILTINLCQTDLLFPFVTNINGFDTGLAIANTTTDPFGTTAQAGTCTLNFYGSGAPSPVTTASVASGTVYANTASTVAPGFQGYMIAVCNFQYAHGFAFVSDVGARNLAMGYLALVVNNGGITARGAAAEALAQ